MVEIHHHLLPFYSAGSQDRQVSVKRCWQKNKKKKATELDLYSLFYYSRTKPLFSAPLCATVGMIAVIPPPLASHQPKCLNLIQSDAYIHKIRAEGFKAVFRLGDSLRGETQAVPVSLLTRSCSLKAPVAKILSMRGIGAPPGKLANHRGEKFQPRFLGEEPDFWEQAESPLDRTGFLLCKDRNMRGS